MYTKNMVKQKKKRTKKYSGVDAAAQRPKVTKITATNRSPAGQWFYDRKKLVKLIGAGLNYHLCHCNYRLWNYKSILTRIHQA